MAQPTGGWFEITGKDRPALQRFSSEPSGCSISDAGDGSGYGLAGPGEKGIARGIGASQDGAQGGATFYVEADDPAAFLNSAGKPGGTPVVPPA